MVKEVQSCNTILKQGSILHVCTGEYMKVIMYLSCREPYEDTTEIYEDITAV